MSNSQLVTDACALVTAMSRGTTSLNLLEQTAAVTLARTTVMLAVYGSKPDAILNVIHDKGHTEVLLSDVKAVRDFILESK